ncbi:hypothetical protein [Dialister succinatiphilus]|uniref:hypothetical protein n=1 Tax=Dialister succinatiphilus TaxID=487173 RepID=UPI004025DD59
MEVGERRKRGALPSFFSLPVTQGFIPALFSFLPLFYMLKYKESLRVLGVKEV